MVVKPGGVTPYSIGWVRGRPFKIDHIAFHLSSSVLMETVNDFISVFGCEAESLNSNRIGLPNCPLTFETNEYDIAPAAMPAHSNNVMATTRIDISIRLLTSDENIVCELASKPTGTNVETSAAALTILFWR